MCTPQSMPPSPPSLLPGVAKSLLPWWECFLLSFMAGAYVGVGGTFAIMVAGGTTGPGGIGVANSAWHGIEESVGCHARARGVSVCVSVLSCAEGLEKFLIGLVFPVALFLIVAMGSDLFTGACLVLCPACVLLL